MSKPIALLGGTFDPVHNGHLRIALEIQQQFDVQEIRFIPCKSPVLAKTAKANAEQRLEMLKLAIQDQSYFMIDERELNRATPSYTIETLKSLREEFPSTPLWLILGPENLTNLNQWRNWQQLLDYAHLFVVARPGYSLPNTGEIAEFIANNKTNNVQCLTQQAYGKIFLTQLSLLTISSTDIRHQLQNKLNPRYLLPDNVLQFIQQQQIYS